LPSSPARKYVELAYAALRAWAYVLVLQFAYVVTLAVNKIIYPSAPWFIAPLILILVASAFWPVTQWSEWPIASANNRLSVAVLRVFLGGLVCFGVVVLMSGYLLGLVGTLWPAPADATESLVVAVPLFLPLFGAWIEEIAFRGMLQGKLERQFGTPIAIAVTSVVFVLAHAGNLGFERQIPFYLVLSVICGILASRSQSLGPAIGVHVFIDALMALATLPGIPLHFRGLSGTSISVVVFVTALSTFGLFFSLKRGGRGVSADTFASDHLEI
jgi:membrane protease YdiL (CAAX protease family)